MMTSLSTGASSSEIQKREYTRRSLRVVLSDAGSIPAASTINSLILLDSRGEFFLPVSFRFPSGFAFNGLEHDGYAGQYMGHSERVHESLTVNFPFPSMTRD